jgi:CubicO group peptidase (beta-lactamase class C family)
MKKTMTIFMTIFQTSLMIFISTLNITLYADTIDASGTAWPIPDWGLAPHFFERNKSQECQDFINFSTKSKTFLTDGLVVIKEGKLEYEHYDPKYGTNTPHVLWSVSKTITGALLGIAVRDGKISLNQHLNEFYPRPLASESYQNIKIENLFFLDTGFLWEERTSSNIAKNSVLNMLYGKGHFDIVDFATNMNLIPEMPGHQWRYSTGTPAITMGVLKQVYGDDYDNMPWELFFNPLGMKHVIFERDHQGVFNGGSSAFATPREMAKMGYLYLKRGKWNGKEILPEEWLEKTLQVSPGYLSEGTVIRDITKDGVFGGSIWLNRAVKKGFGKPYPASPEDMYLAIGHNGQLIIVLPTQKMVIARTARDFEFNSKVDEFVTRAISCFDNPSYIVGKIIPPSQDSKTTLPTILKILKSGIRNNILKASLAKNVCSCHFISKLDAKTCLERSTIPFAQKLIDISINNNFVFSDLSLLAKSLTKAYGIQEGARAVASFDQKHPQFGCTLK